MREGVRRLSTGSAAVGLAVTILGCLPLRSPSTKAEIEDQSDRRSSRELMGVVVVEVPEASALARAGLLPGDVIRAWERPSRFSDPAVDRGRIDSVFDWMWLEVEQAPRGPVTLFGEREGVERTFDVMMGKWGGKLRPILPTRALSVYTQGREELDKRNLEKGVHLWSQLSELVEENDYGQWRSWIGLMLGEAYSERRAWGEALKAYLAALEEAETPAAKVAIWRRIGRVHERRSARVLDRRSVRDQAAASYRSGLEIAESTWGTSLHSADMKSKLGVVAMLLAADMDAKLSAWAVQRDSRLEASLTRRIKSQRAAASNHFKEALEIREKLAPGSLELAQSLGHVQMLINLVGFMTYEIWTGTPEESAGFTPTERLGGLGASSRFRRALEIQERLAPEGLELARSLNNLGYVAYHYESLELASEYFQRALEIQEQLAPFSLEMATSLTNLGVMAWRGKDLELASDYFQRALEIREQLVPHSADLARSLRNLGNVAWLKDSFFLAKECFQRDLEIQQELAAGSLDEAGSLFLLASLEWEQDQMEAGEVYMELSQNIQMRMSLRMPGKGDIYIIMRNYRSIYPELSWYF